MHARPAEKYYKTSSSTFNNPKPRMRLFVCAAWNELTNLFGCGLSTEFTDAENTGKWSANFLPWASCASAQDSLASNPESRPAKLVMVVTDF